MVRNVVGPGHAPQGAVAALRFDAPPGTSITGADFDVRMTSNPGWDAGIQDATNERWLWCGPDCLSSFERWMHEELRGLATQRLQALVRCSATRCRRDARHGFVALRNVRVYLDDPSAPRLDGVRGALATAGGAWLRGLARRGVRRRRQQRHPARADRARRAHRARRRAQLRLRPRRALLRSERSAPASTRARGPTASTCCVSPPRTRAATGPPSTASCGSTTPRRPSRSRSWRAATAGTRAARGRWCCRCRAGSRRR